MFYLYLLHVWKGTETGWLQGGLNVGSEQLLQDVGVVVVTVSTAASQRAMLVFFPCVHFT